MFESLFGNPVIEKILFTLNLFEECYAYELSKTFEAPVNQFQQQLKRLEDGGIIVSRLIGRCRVYAFNPRYPFLDELRILINRGYNFLPDSEKEKFYIKRKRPRRTGKP